MNSTNTPGNHDSTPRFFKITRPGTYDFTGKIASVAHKHGIETVASRATQSRKDLDLGARFSAPGNLGSTEPNANFSY